MSRTNTQDKRPLYQHITVIGDIGHYEVEVDEDPRTRREFHRYNDALLHVIRFLSDCAMEHGANKGEEVKSDVEV
jgi:hypothetical protein